MRYQLPPLNALRAYEAAARHANISRAGEELCVTPGAISRHIAILEDNLGCLLLVRQHRGVRPTDAGMQYLKEIASAFERIDRAGRSLGRKKPLSKLSVRLFTTLSTDWLPSRIDKFRALHPEIGLTVSASTQAPNFDLEDIDIGMMFGPGDWPALHYDVLFRGRFTPVCTPALLERGEPLCVPADLRNHNLLYSSLQTERWEEWLMKAGVEGFDTSAGLRFESSSHAYHAARQGAGLALAQTFFVMDDLRSGHLVAPFSLQVDHPLSYCLVCPKNRKDEPAVHAFRTWIVEEVHRTNEEATGLLAT
jgi:LysR family glycine cleavage system transcriptional activator